VTPGYRHGQRDRADDLCGNGHRHDDHGGPAECALQLEVLPIARAGHQSIQSLACEDARLPIAKHLRDAGGIVA
jgi:hypothetical protein